LTSFSITVPAFSYSRFGCRMLAQVRTRDVRHVDLEQVYPLSEMRQPSKPQVQKKRALGADPSYFFFRNAIPLRGL
jgi:hypothetical protein